MATYQRFNPDLWTIVFNYEAIAVVTSIAKDALKVTGHFRTQADYIGLNFMTKDFWNHRYVRYKEDKDYSGTHFSFIPKYKGEIAQLNSIEQQPPLIIEKENDESYISLGMQGVKNNGKHTFLFNKEIKLPNSWIQVNSEVITWIDPANPNVVVSKPTKAETDYDMDYVRGKFYTTEGGIIPYNAQVTITYKYNTHERYSIDFDNLYEGTHPSSLKRVSPRWIERVGFPVIPTYFKAGDRVMTGRSDTFELSLTSIKVTGGEIGTIPKKKQINSYRLAEGFDDEYDKNPKRLIDSMELLGYEGVINLYIGASHFYDKKGTKGVISKNEKSMTLDATKGINNSFITWMNALMDNMKLKGFDDIIISVAMENLQLPEDWKQRLWDGTAGASGWEPPTNFYSPTNPDVKVFIERITRETLDLVVAKGFKPTLQLGESWFWWQEFAPGDVNAPYKGRPPAFYDRTTKERFKKEMGYDLPVYKSSDVQMDNRNEQVAFKLRQYLGEFTVFMNSIIKDYKNSQFTILFFPPSVMDEARTPEILRIVNAPFEYWKYPILDFIQIEDYDWVTREQPEHEDIYTHAWFEMGYPFNKQHYFAGFVLLPENAYKEWKLIERAAQEALGRGFLEVFIWAGTQIRRDSWVPRLNTYVADAEPWNQVSMKQEIDI